MSVIATVMIAASLASQSLTPQPASSPTVGGFLCALTKPNGAAQRKTWDFNVVLPAKRSELVEARRVRFKDESGMVSGVFSEFVVKSTSRIESVVSADDGRKVAILFTYYPEKKDYVATVWEMSPGAEGGKNIATGLCTYFESADAASVMELLK